MFIKLKKYIPKNLKEYIKKSFKIIPNENSKDNLSRSLSNNFHYPNFCLKASNDLKIFKNFRRNYNYQLILEHLSYKDGEKYLEEIRNNYQFLIKNFDIFRLNDSVGNPESFEYDGIGIFSPTTLRYIKVLGDLINHFNNLNDLRICEIGVGYGGQCRIINSYFKPSKYTLVDIKPALMLAQTYLDNFVIRSTLEYKTMNELEYTNYDLLISNYAFTELARDVQDLYLNKVILNSKMGYITYNDINPEFFKSYKKEELLAIIPNSFIIEEKPLTHKNNCIIIWK